MDASTSSIHELYNQNRTCDIDVKSYQYFLTVLYILLLLGGLSLNVFTMWFHCCADHGYASKGWLIYLTHLTVANFLACISVPMRIIYYFSSSYNIHLVYCSIGFPLFFVNRAASILFVSYIAANRYIKIISSPGSHILMTAKVSHIISIATWVVLLSLSLPYSFLVLLNEEYHDDDKHIMCDHMIIETLKILHTTSHAVAFIIFLSGFSSLIFFYYSISRRVLQVQQRRMSSTNSKRLVKSRRNMLVLVSVFCFCFVPYHIFLIPHLILHDRCSLVMYCIKEFAVLLSVSNICLDPLTYVFLCKEFRAQFNLIKIFCPNRQRSICDLEASVSDDQQTTNPISTITPVNDTSEL